MRGCHSDLHTVNGSISLVTGNWAQGPAYTLCVSVVAAGTASHRAQLPARALPASKVLFIGGETGGGWGQGAAAGT